MASLLRPDLTAATGTLMPGAEAIHPIKLNGVDPQAWLADVLAQLPDHSVKRIDELLPWNWVPGRRTATTWQRSATPCRPTP